MTRTALVLAAAAALAGCSSMSGRHVVSVATREQEAALIEQMKPLAGTWEMKDDKGQTVTAAVFSVGSGGSAIREIMFPGSPHEMTNIYTMDGPTLLMTHYCAMGNQPHLRATAGNTPGVIALRFDSVSNLRSADEHYMGELTITIKDKNHITEEWRSFTGGKLADENVKFDLTRKN